MNPNGQPQPNQPNQPPAGSPPPAPNNWQQPQSAQNSWQQPAQSGWNQQSYTQPSQALPSQPSTPTQYSADYLDQIAPGAGGPKLFSGSFTWILVGLAVVFMFAVGIIALSSGGNNTASAQTAYFKIENLIIISDNYRRYLKSSKLTTTNTNFKIFLSGAKTDITTPLTQNGFDVTKPDQTLKGQEKSVSTELASTLEDARLNAILDRVYAREMAYQAQLLLELYTKMTKSNAPGIADTAKKTIPNLQPIQKSFADFSGAED